MIFVFLCLTDLSMTLSRSLHIAAHGIISFFVMAAHPCFQWCCPSPQGPVRDSPPTMPELIRPEAQAGPRCSPGQWGIEAGPKTPSPNF